MFWRATFFLGFLALGYFQQPWQTPSGAGHVQGIRQSGNNPPRRLPPYFFLPNSQSTKTLFQGVKARCAGVCDGHHWRRGGGGGNCSNPDITSFQQVEKTHQSKYITLWWKVHVSSIRSSIRESGELLNTEFHITFLATVPALGMQTYFVRQVCPLSRWF